MSRIAGPPQGSSSRARGAYAELLEPAGRRSVATAKASTLLPSHDMNGRIRKSYSSAEFSREDGPRQLELGAGAAQVATSTSAIGPRAFLLNRARADTIQSLVSV